MIRSVAVGLLAAWAALGPILAAPMPRYDHVFIIIEENRTADQIIGNPAAPAFNRLAKNYGYASNYFAVAHPSQPNYIALLGGDTFGITDDDAYFCKPGDRRAGCSHAGESGYVNHTIRAPALTDRLEGRGLSWKGYFESIPQPGSTVDVWPASGPRAGLYAVKHNGFMAFKSVQDDPRRTARIVGFDALERDIAADALPNFAQIVPDQCDDMHGRASCRDGTELVKRADATLGRIVKQIMATPMWKGAQNCAIVVTFDEDGGDSLNLNSWLAKLPSAGGWIATIVITNHGPRGLTDATAYDHYSLLRSLEGAFGLSGHLGHAAAASAMTPMFALLARKRAGP